MDGPVYPLGAGVKMVETFTYPQELRYILGGAW